VPIKPRDQEINKRTASLLSIKITSQSYRLNSVAQSFEAVALERSSLRSAQRHAVGCHDDHGGQADSSVSSCRQAPRCSQLTITEQDALISEHLDHASHGATPAASPKTGKRLSRPAQLGAPSVNGASSTHRHTV